MRKQIIHFLFLFTFLIPFTFFGQDINGELSDGGIYKNGEYLYVYGFKDKKNFKVIKYDIEFTVIAQYEKELTDQVAVEFGVYQYKFLNVRNELEFNIYYNLKKSRGSWIKLDFNLKELDCTPYSETESKAAIQNKTNEVQLGHTPLVYTDIINGYYDSQTFQDQLMKNTYFYQNGTDIYVFQSGDKGVTYKFEKGLFNKENGAVRKYKIKSDKGFPVMDQEWETPLETPYTLPVQAIPSLSNSKQLTFLRNSREIITLDNQSGSVLKKIKFDFGHNQVGEDFISNICTKYIPEKEVFVSCGLITHENKGLKKAVGPDFENKKYFIYLFDKNGTVKNKVEQDLPTYEVKKSGSANLKYRGMDFQADGIVYDNNQLTIYAVNTVGAVLAEEGPGAAGGPFSGAAAFGSSGVNNNSIGFSSNSLCNIMIGISAHNLTMDDYSYKYSFFQDKNFSDSKYTYQQEIKFYDIEVNSLGCAIILGESNFMEADFVWKKAFKTNSAGAFTELKVKNKYTYFIGKSNLIFLFDRGGNDGKFKISLPK